MVHTGTDNLVIYVIVGFGILTVVIVIGAITLYKIQTKKLANDLNELRSHHSVHGRIERGKILMILRTNQNIKNAKLIDL